MFFRFVCSYLWEVFRQIFQIEAIYKPKLLQTKAECSNNINDSGNKQRHMKIDMHSRKLATNINKLKPGLNRPLQGHEFAICFRIIQ